MWMGRRLLLALLAVGALAWPAGATWSILIVDRRTGEVAVGGATCLATTNLLAVIPAVAVGRGAGCIQSRADTPSLVRLYDQLVLGSDPATVLAVVKAGLNNPGVFQIGVVALDGAPVTFTGNGAGEASDGVAGEVGDLAYAIQGNLMTGPAVWLDAEAALLGTPGDLATKLMAAMEAARAAGGDGRCSCNLGMPEDCGAPPPSFEKSAHCGFVVVARMGDVDSACVVGPDCANGSYHLKLNVKGADARPSSPDPVLQLRDRFDEWRASLAGEPDGVLSRVTTVQSLPADGTTSRSVTVRLSDIEGTPLAGGGDAVTVATLGGGPALASVSPVVDHGDGTYTFELTAGTTPGTDRFVVSALAGGRRIHLYPYLEVRTDPVRPLHVGYDQVSVAEAPAVPFVLNVPSNANGAFIVLASLSGTVPGTAVGSVLVPLNRDALTWSTLLRAGDPSVLPGTIGFLDANGRAEAELVLGPRQMLALAGLHLDWAGLVLGGSAPLATNAVGFDLVP